MLNIIVCENERAEREYLAALIKKWAGLRNAAIRFSAYESAESFLFAYEEDKAADILLLDIQIHYAEVENMYNQMRGWRHDYRNHIQAMKGHANSGDLAAISRYLDELDTDLKKVDTIIKTGNKMADAILDSKISLARSKNITVIADANIAVELKTSQLELCIIIGNLFDNAVEACLSLPEDRRLIRIYMEMKQTQLYMSFTNTAGKGKLRKVGGRFLTAKGDGHGFGLARIDRIVERHCGYLSRSSEDGAYTTEILLPQ